MFMLLIFMLCMFMLPMFVFPCALALELAGFAEPVFAGAAGVFALPAVFELFAVEQADHRAVAVSKSTKAKVRCIEAPPMSKIQTALDTEMISLQVLALS